MTPQEITDWVKARIRESLAREDYYVRQWRAKDASHQWPILIARERAKRDAWRQMSAALRG